MVKKSLSLFLALCIVIGLAACGDSGAPSTASTSDAGSTSPSTPAPTVTSGVAATSAKTHLNIGMAAEVTSLDPSLSPDCVTPTGWAYTGQMFDQLLRYDQSTREFIPGLATSWEISEDATEVVFTLRENVKFHNGDTMTADDVLFSLTRALESPYTTSVNSSIDHFEKVDDNHVKVVLKYGYVPILQVLDVPCWGIVSKRAVEECEASGADFGRNPVGTGAYKLKNWVSGEKVEFEAHEDYYDGAPAIKTVTIVLVPDQAAGSLALEEGSIDFNQGIPKTDIPYLSSLDTLSVIELTGGAVNDLTFNCTDGIFTDKRLRQAVAYALDLDEILIGGQEGYGSVANVLCTPKAVGWVEDIEPVKQDLDKAKQLMAEAGYPDGFDVVFSQDSSNTYMPTAEVIQAQLKKVGINVTFEKTERSAWFDVVGAQRNFVATARMTTFSLFDADYILTRRLTEQALGGGNNYSGWHTPEFEALLDQARRETDAEKRKEIYRECYLIIQEEVPIIPLYNYAEFIVFSSKLQGVQSVTGNRNLWSKMYFVE